MIKTVFEKELQRESVFVDRDIISPHYIPEELPFREKQINELSRILTPTIKGKKPNNVFLYGKTGTGKTCCSKYVLKELSEFATEMNAKVKTIYINCSQHNSKYKTILKVTKEIYPEKNFFGYSAAFVYEKILEHCNSEKSQNIIVLDEIDKVKDLDELIYSLSRCNDEITSGGISLIGISNNLTFKDKLSPRTKSSLCEIEMVFPPYNANELKAILEKRSKKAFKKNSVTDSAINLAAAIAAQQSGDARTAVTLLLRAGELSDARGVNKVTDKEVEEAKKKVEEEVIINMISTLPDQEKLVLYAIALLTKDKKGIKRLSGNNEEQVLVSGTIYDYYLKLAKEIKTDSVSARWYREYINELEMYGLIITTQSGQGIRGQTKLIKLNYNTKRVIKAIEKDLK